MKRRGPRQLVRGGLSLLGVGLALASPAQNVEPASTPQPPERVPLARVGDETLYVDEIEGALAFRIYQLELDIYSLLKGEAERRIEARLLSEAARERGTSIEAMLEEIETGAEGTDAIVRDAEVDAYLAEHPPSDPSHRERARERVRNYLTERGRIARRIAFLASLREAAGARILLEPPPRPRTEFDIADAPTRGPVDAPITIVHFASFGSRNSARSAQKLARLAREFPGQIRFAHVHLLSDRDEAGLLVARVAFAAAEKGQFWPLHDALFEAEGRLDPPAIESIALAAGLSAADVARATATPARLRQVKADIDRAIAAGVPREPGLFVNGLFVSGLLPYEDLEAVVEEELSTRSAPTRSRP